MKRLLAAEAQGFAPICCPPTTNRKTCSCAVYGRRALGRDTLTEQLWFRVTTGKSPLGNAASKSNCGRTCATNIPGNQSVFALVSVARVLEPYEPDLRARGSAPENLIDAEIREASSTAIQPPQAPQPEVLQSRTFDGSYNDLSQPRMSAIGAAFDRNMQPVYGPDLAAYAEQQVSDARAASGAQRRGQSLCRILAPALLQTLPARRAFRWSE